VGKYLARESADTLKKLSLELGGNAPFIVFEDADLDAAVDGLMRGKFRNSGQTCVSPNRVYVHEAIHDDFAGRLAARVRALTVGPASNPTAEIGPMINERAIDKINRHVKDALSKGAVVLTGGNTVRDHIADGPFYYSPTILTNSSEEMALFCEETFGPVVPLFTFSNEDEVIQKANQTPFGLAAYFYTQNAARICRVSSQLEAGVIGINEGVVASEAAPFGGIKESGYGREGSKYGLDDYMQLKYLCEGELA
jgi:succinate-semialdehyde dehydrogenase/glutarate-semialdehyde dehydrogenase